MRKHAIRGYQKRRGSVRTTVPEPADQKVPELLKRNLTVEVPNRRYVGDTTFRWYDTVLARLFSATTILPVRGGPRGGVTVAQGTRLSALAAFFVGDLSKGVRLFARNLSGKVHDGDRFSGRYHDGAG